MSSWWLLWMVFMFVFLFSPGSYGWGYRSWGPPCPRYVPGRRGQRAAAIGDPAPFDHHAWGWGGDLVWTAPIMGMIRSSLRRGGAELATSRVDRENEAQLDELGDDPGQVGSDSGGQSGDPQGLSPIADEADESVQELAETGQAYEADVVAGVEDADDHPERPVYTHERDGQSADIEPGSKAG